MKIAKILLLAALVAPVCRADDSVALANQLLDLSGTATFMQQTFETGLKPSLDQMRAKGAPAELVDAIHAEARNFFQENFNWEIMKPKLAKLYADNYTEAELKDIIAFYQTPTGQKTLAKMPVLMQQSLTMSMSGVQANMPEFQRRISGLIQEYQKKAQAAAAVAAAAAPTPTSAPAAASAPATVTVPTEPSK
jgi:uncharacterized protein